MGADCCTQLPPGAKLMPKNHDQSQSTIQWDCRNLCDSGTSVLPINYENSKSPTPVVLHEKKSNERVSESPRRTLSPKGGKPLPFKDLAAVNTKSTFGRSFTTLFSSPRNRGESEDVVKTSLARQRTARLTDEAVANQMLMAELKVKQLQEELVKANQQLEMARSLSHKELQQRQTFVEKNTFYKLPCICDDYEVCDQATRFEFVVPRQFWQEYELSNSDSGEPILQQIETWHGKYGLRAIQCTFFNGCQTARTKFFGQNSTKCQQTFLKIDEPITEIRRRSQIEYSDKTDWWPVNLTFNGNEALTCGDEDTSSQHKYWRRDDVVNKLRPDQQVIGIHGYLSGGELKAFNFILNKP